MTMSYFPPRGLTAEDGTFAQDFIYARRTREVEGYF